MPSRPSSPQPSRDGERRFARDALVRFFMVARPKLLDRARHLHAPEAEDLVQETILRLLEMAANGSVPETDNDALHRLAHTILRNKHIDNTRHHHVVATHLASAIADEHEDAAITFQPETAHDLHTALRALSGDDIDLLEASLERGGLARYAVTQGLSEDQAKRKHAEMLVKLRKRLRGKRQRGWLVPWLLPARTDAPVTQPTSTTHSALIVLWLLLVPACALGIAVCSGSSAAPHRNRTSVRVGAMSDSTHEEIISNRNLSAATAARSTHQEGTPHMNSKALAAAPSSPDDGQYCQIYHKEDLKDDEDAQALGCEGMILLRKGCSLTSHWAPRLNIEGVDGTGGKVLFCENRVYLQHGKILAVNIGAGRAEVCNVSGDCYSIGGLTRLRADADKPIIEWRAEDIL